MEKDTKSPHFLFLIWKVWKVWERVSPVSRKYFFIAHELLSFQELESRFLTLWTSVADADTQGVCRRIRAERAAWPSSVSQARFPVCGSACSLVLGGSLLCCLVTSFRVQMTSLKRGKLLFNFFKKVERSSPLWLWRKWNHKSGYWWQLWNFCPGDLQKWNIRIRSLK